MSVILRMISRFRLIFMMGQTVEEVERKMHGFNKIEIMVVNCQSNRSNIEMKEPLLYLDKCCCFYYNKKTRTCYIFTDAANKYSESYVLSHKKDFIVHRWYETEELYSFGDY